MGVWSTEAVSDAEGSASFASTRISVLIPTFNRASQIVETLESVRRQTTPVHEIILVDDGSTDATERIVTEVLSVPDWGARLRYVRQTNQGKSVALNRALELVTGDWVAFNDSDDLWEPTKLSRQLEALRQFPECGVCFSSVRYANNPERGGTSFDDAVYPYEAVSGVLDDAAQVILQAPHGVYMQTVIVRSDIMGAVGDFDPRFRVSQDTDFLFRLALHARWCYVNEPLVLLDRSDQRTVGLTTQFTRSGHVRLGILEQMYEGWLVLAARDREDLSADVRRRLEGVRFEQASADLRLGQVREARRRSVAAVRVRWSCRAIGRLVAVLLFPGWCVQRARGGAGS